jgi:two-component system, NtrC family, response regulator
MRPVVLIVDDEEELALQMKWALSGTCDVHVAGDREGALNHFTAHKPSVVLLDLGLPPSPGNSQEGFRALQEMRELDPQAKIIIISGQGDRENALRAVRDGASDFLIKPVDLDMLQVVLKRTVYIDSLERENRRLSQSIPEESFDGMLGHSPQMQAVYTCVRKVAASDVPVLVLGESGTGKELVASSIHHRSPRRDAPFVPINCGAIPENLLESELFGHEKGSFTGAHVQRAGRIETAAGGTLFLDEIAELPLGLQVKLLRFLQEGQIERIGARKEVQVDVRIVAATNIDLEKAIQEGRFREDLYYRLAVIEIKLPALRDRTGDALFLARAFLQRYGEASGKPALQFDRSAVRALESHRWPGNVRELENRVKRAIIMADSSRVSAEDLELAGVLAHPERNLKQARAAVEREVIEEALRRHRGKIQPAAAELGISRPTFYELMDKLGVRRG